MPAELVIRDGNPHWWNSPDIWVVPGADPNGPPGIPVAGQPAYLWSRVENRGDAAVAGARLNFYWSNPATGVLRSNSTLVGFAFADLGAGETKEVLCIVPWVPVVVNDGHECVVVEVLHPADPLPTPPPDDFDPPRFRQVAQRNLTVLEASSRRMRVLPVQLAAPRRKGRRLRVAVETGGKLDGHTLASLGLGALRPAGDAAVEAYLGRDAGCGASGEKGEREVEVELEPGTARAVYLNVPPQKVEPGTYALLHVVSRDGEKVAGGITYVVVAGDEAAQAQQAAPAQKKGR